MYIYFKVIVILYFLAIGLDVSAQESTAPDLVKQGIELNNQKKFTEASEKYKAALAMEPDNLQANYQMAFTLFSAGKNADALAYIDKATKGDNPKFTAAAYSLMGSIYQGTKQLPNAVMAYQNAIKADGSNQRIYYNLGIAYFKGKQYKEAETTFEEALKRDSADAGSWRMYALATFHQNKRAQALLGFCAFLTLQPNSSRSAEAYGNLQNVLQQGVLKPEAGYKPSAITKGLADYQNQILKKALAGAGSKKYASAVDELSGQLGAVFNALAFMPRDKYYGWYTVADYFGKLPAASLPAFARYISQSAVPVSAKWLKDNPEKAKILESWLAVNRPTFMGFQ